MRRLQGGQNPFQARAQVEAFQSLGVRDVGVAHAAAVLPVAVLRADARIIKSGGHGMDIRRLAVGILENVAITLMQDARLAVGQRGSMASWLGTAPPCL